MSSKIKTDTQIKTEATQRERYRVFENMNAPQDIYAECSDGTWFRGVWRNVKYFGWDKWKKV
jgi:hypothetical protein